MGNVIYKVCHTTIIEGTWFCLTFHKLKNEIKFRTLYIIAIDICWKRSVTKNSYIFCKNTCFIQFHRMSIEFYSEDYEFITHRALLFTFLYNFFSFSVLDSARKKEDCISVMYHKPLWAKFYLEEKLAKSRLPWFSYL